jgi:hypothetical protein
MTRPRRARRVRPEVDGSILRWPGAAQRFALFGEVLWLGVLMAVVCIPVVTWPAAVAAGSAHLRRFLAAEATPVSAFFADVRTALPGALVPGVVSVALAALAAVDVALLTAGVVPGGLLVAVVATAVAAVAVVLVVLAASVWTPGTPWRMLVAAAPRIARADISGTVYILVALGLAAVITWQFLPLGIPALGLLSFALVAIGERRMVRLIARAA